MKIKLMKFEKVLKEARSTGLFFRRLGPQEWKKDEDWLTLAEFNNYDKELYIHRVVPRFKDEGYMPSVEDILCDSWQLCSPSVQDKLMADVTKAHEYIPQLKQELTRKRIKFSVEHDDTKFLSEKISVKLKSKILHFSAMVDGRGSLGSWIYFAEEDPKFKTGKYEFKILNDGSIMSVKDAIAFIKREQKSPKDWSHLQKIKELI